MRSRSALTLFVCSVYIFCLNNILRVHSNLTVSENNNLISAQNVSNSNTRQSRSSSIQVAGGIENRDGYGYPGYHYVIPFLEPLNILAGLAFIAYLVQTFHALLLFHHRPAAAAPAPVSTGHHPTLVGSVVDNLVPTRVRQLQENHNFLELLRIIENDLKKSKRRNRDKKSKNQKTTTTATRNPDLHLPRKKK